MAKKTYFFGKLTLAAPTSVKSSSLTRTWPIFFIDGLFERARPEEHASEEIFPLPYLEEKILRFFRLGGKNARQGLLQARLQPQPLGRFFSGMAYLKAQEVPSTQVPRLCL